MRLLIALISALFAVSVSGSTISKHRKRAPSPQKEANAIIKNVLAWRNDTKIVSDFIEQARYGGSGYGSQQSWSQAATAAYNAELDEATHKAFLDQNLPSSKALQNANYTLVGEGTVASVVALLGNLTNIKYTQNSKIENIISEIDFGHNGIPGRCQAVLPAVNVYFQQAAKYVKSLDNDTSLRGVTAVSPYACCRACGGTE